MIELLSLAGGALVRLAPVLLSFFEKGRDLKYEIKRMEVEFQLEEQRAKYRAQEIELTGKLALQAQELGAFTAAIEAEGRREALTDTGSRWLNFFNVINTSVRPILTYWWCVVLYSSHKALIGYIAWTEKVGLKNFGELLLTDFDKAVVGSIMGFWFTDRMLQKYAIR